MAYRIEYDSKKQKYEVSDVTQAKLPVMVCGAFAAFLLLTVMFWSEGAEVLRDAVIPGDDSLTIQALDVLAENIRDGVPVSQAFTNFCREIIHGA